MSALKRHRDGAVAVASEHDLVVNVKLFTGKTITLNVKPADTIADIKLRIQDHEGIPKDHQRLLFDGNQLVDSHVLSVYKVPNEATLQLLYRLYPTQHGLPTIVVKSWTGDVMRINAESGDTILSIKLKIRDINGTLPHQQRLVFRETALMDDHTLRDYDIQNKAILHLVQNQRGGMYHHSSGRDGFGRIICSGVDTHHYEPDPESTTRACHYFTPAVAPHPPGVVNCPHNEIIAFREEGRQEELQEAMLRLEAAERATAFVAGRDEGACSGTGSVGVASSCPALAADPALGMVALLQCCICHDTCVEPASTPCGHSFCLDHLKDWVAAQAPEAACPVCRAPIQQRAEDVVVNAAVKRLIEELYCSRVMRSLPPAAASVAPVGGAATPPPGMAVPYDRLVFERDRRGDRMELGRGPAASVYRAAFGGEPVAVKTLVLSAGTTATELATLERRFLQESTLQFHMSNPGIAPLLGVSVDRDVVGGPPTALALIMPLTHHHLGVAVALPSAGPAELALCLRWLQQIARALAALHAAGIVHGDLKPSNVLLDASGPDARALLSDVGHGWLQQQQEQGDAALLGTQRYRDPAVASGRSLLRKASDVYSFGLLAWHALAGRPPFEGLGDAVAVAAHAVAGGRPDPDALPAAVPGPLRVLLSRCWWANQNDRPTAAALVERLEAPECRIAGLA